MSKVNNKDRNALRKYFTKQKSSRHMPNFALNNWRKIHREPMRRRVHCKRIRYSNCKRHE